MTERTTIIKAIQSMGDSYGNPGGDFAPPAARLLSEHFTEEELDTVEAELAKLSEDELDDVIDDPTDDNCEGIISPLADRVLDLGFACVEYAYDRGLIEGA